MLINNKGEAYISVLSENDDGYYDMYHGIGNKQVNYYNYIIYNYFYCIRNIIN